MNHPDINSILAEVSRAVEKGIEDFNPIPGSEETGKVLSVSEGIVWATGLTGVGYEERVHFQNGVTGMVIDILPERVGIILFGSGDALRSGEEITRSRRVMDIPVGPDILGRVVGPLGNPMDGLGPIKTKEKWEVFREAPQILDRDPVEKPLATGLKTVDALVPVGRGQRELILGDRQTGKTALALDTIIHQKDQQVKCIYCAIGVQSSSTAKVIADLKKHGAMEYTAVVVVEGDAPPGLQYIAPYAATTMAEYFMSKGEDVLIIYDDLTRHALAYRQLSLLLRRPPGREAFPGDIFYIHSRLLERATHLTAENGGGSLTALPIAETEAQNLSAYIPTNLISITDGQIYLSPDLFQKGVLPAVDVGKSVSRVGGKAQWPAYRNIAGELRLSYTQFQELESFARFGARLDEHTRKTLEHGLRVRESLKQNQFSPISTVGQIGILMAVAKGYYDDVPIEEIPRMEKILLAQIHATAEGTDARFSDLNHPLWSKIESMALEMVKNR